MSKEVFPIYKPEGLSPLDAVKKLKKENLELQDEKVAYAGRLDPMAEGVVLIVTGDSLKKFKHFLKLDKEYEAEILFGFSSDSLDVLGLAEKKEKDSFKEEEVEKVLKSLEGEFVFKPPFFSSYRYKGKPLFWWARQGRLEEVELPDKKTAIYSLEILDKMKIEKKFLEEKIEEKIKKVKGDFRQEEITKKWRSVFQKEGGDKKYLIVKIKVHCSSGCYIRSIADRTGRLLNSGAILFSLKRIRIGKYKLNNF
jgi:tRNA pseudouridine(55) synthase